MADILISVRGEAERRVSPELAAIHVTAATDGPERADVVSRATAAAAPLRERLELLSDDGAVTTWSSGSISIWSDRPWNADGRQLAPVHHAAIELTAVFSDIAGLSEWADTLAGDEAVRVSQVEWLLASATRAAVEREVAATALDVAVGRATAYAAALGRTSVEPVEIADVGLLGGSDPQPPQPSFARAAMLSADSGAAGFELRPSDIVVTAAVEGRFVAR
ncbi:SIMPL domain-containing protein [Microbacterium oleivorans]|uniref:SIMPL domain-containing protein n=1 Tax=Microbacterium oleivorans TaxID=273677 RepID=A0A7D5F6J5_9MICO|nr:SIMPL domain-containing protein [Microbacterium oleivorans]QLD13107.1 SIMPL domain-containing protein [Microbacterium oleivorans]